MKKRDEDTSTLTKLDSVGDRLKTFSEGPSWICFSGTDPWAHVMNNVQYKCDVEYSLINMTP